MSQQELKKDERFTFVTFTITNPRTSLSQARKIVNRSWTLFRKRKFCVSLIRGGSKSEEFTLTSNGFHYHLHCIFLSRWFQFNELRRVWTECVEQAFAEADLPFKVTTKDGLLIVKVKPIVSREGSIQEVCKYVTKSDSWIKMSQDDLVTVALIRRWHRMFELFGSFKLSETSSDADEQRAEGDLPIVHTGCITDGTSHERRYWRDHIGTNSDLEVYLKILEQRIEYERTNRITSMSQLFPQADIKSADELGIG
jgi:hypothetical protein